MWRGLIGIIFVVNLTGCTANHASIFRQVDASQTQAIMADAKQRAILTIAPSQPIRFCAEPSPDALSAISSSLSTSLSVEVFGEGKGTGQVAAALQEAAKEIGRRSQAVQLFRDGWYRLCESSRNEDISADTYDTLARTYADLTMVWLAIEQLSGMATPSAPFQPIAATPTLPTPIPPSPSTPTPPSTPPQSPAASSTTQSSPGISGQGTKLERSSDILEIGDVFETAFRTKVGRYDRSDMFQLMTQQAQVGSETGETEQPSRTLGSDVPTTPRAEAEDESNPSPDRSSDRSEHVSEAVAKVAAVILIDYLQRSRFSECVAELRRIREQRGADLQFAPEDLTVINACDYIMQQQSDSSRLLADIFAQPPLR